MSSTTQILFNSPALHSLKRDQLVKLCKIHHVKANGKNGEMIERLKLCARDLPADSPLSIAVRSEESQGEEEQEEQQSSHRGYNARPSEQWEVMDSIAEMEESGSQGTLSSMRTIGGAASEFGTGSTKASNSVGSSLKAFATSLGLKRPKTDGPPPPPLATEDTLMETSVPYSSIPDDTVAPESPIPGHALRPGLPAPINARLSMGLTTPNPKAGASTTIRLVNSNRLSVAPSTPKLSAFTTSFDLVLGSPTTERTSMWPASPGQGDRVYPALPTSFAAFGVPPLPLDDPMDEDDDDEDEDASMPGGMGTTPARALSRHIMSQPADMFSPVRPTAAAMATPRAAPRLSAAPADAFIFGSPLPQHNMSNVQFRSAAASVVGQSSAAASVLEEMNKRLAGNGIALIGSDLINQEKLRAAQGALASGSGSSKSQGTDIKSKFERAHDANFDKMDSIADHYAARRQKRKSSVLGDDAGAKRRKSSGLKPSGRTSGGLRVRPSTSRAPSGGVRVKRGTVPGGFGGDDGDEDEEEDEGDRRSSKRPRVDPEVLTAQPEKIKRVSIAPLDDPVEEARKEKERAAVRRHLDKNIAKRRSSMGRPSIGGRAAVPPPKTKAATSRFGFFSSAKSLVQNAWSKGTGKTSTKAPAPAPPPVAVAAKAPAPTPAAPPPAAKKSGFVPSRPSATNTTGSSSSRPSTSNRLSKPPPAASSSSLKPPPTEAGTVSSVASSSRSRSPLPAFAAPVQRKTSAVGTSGSRTSIAASGSSKFGSRNSSIAGTSSIGTKSGAAAGSRVSSLGTKGITGSDAGNVKRAGSVVGTLDGARARTSSRLMMPTASSLAKRTSTAAGDTSLAGRLPAVPEPRPQLGSTGIPSPAKTQRTMTSHPSTPIRSPRAVGSIFSKPLLSPSSIPTPMHYSSLSGAANTLVADAMAPKAPVVPPKPKVLPGRKPRISRSRVIAKLASQRAQTVEASGSGSGTTPAVASSSKTRSSMGAGLKAGHSGRGSSGGDVLMSAKKKRARQSEHARRKSNRASAAAAGGRRSDAMDLS